MYMTEPLRIQVTPHCRQGHKGDKNLNVLILAPGKKHEGPYVLKLQSSYS